MQWNTKARQAALTTLICLSLSAPVFAMPTGGVATSGSDVAISTGDLSNVQSGATITANKNSIINWQEFGIKEGETLNFNTQNGALLNRVTGTKISELLGTLNQKGECPLMLVNPNGIVVGSSAVIDAQTLVLSTLAISDNEFQKVVGNAAATGTFAQEGDKTGALTIAKGATVNIDNLLMLLGGTVDVADGVKFTLDDATKDDVALNVAAGKKITIDTTGNDVDYQDLLGTVTADSTNKVSFSGDVTNQSQNLDVKIQGGAIDLSNANMDLNGNGSLYAIAAKDATDADAGNKLSATDFTVKNGDTALLIGGTVDLKDSSVTAGKADIYAPDTMKATFDEKTGNLKDLTITSTKDNAITLDNTKFTGTRMNTSTNEDQGDMGIQGGAVTLKNGTEVSAGGTVTILAAKSFEDGKTINAGAGNTVTVDKTSKVTAGVGDDDGEEINIAANKVVTDGATLTAKKVNTGEGSVLHYDNASSSIVVDQKPAAESTDNPGGGSKTDTPTTPTEPTQPTDTPTKTPEQKPFNAEDAKNIASGEALAGEAITGNAHFAQRQEALVNSIEKLNAATDERAAAGQMLGILQGIKNADLTTPEKQLLQLSVLNAYTPTQGRADDTDKKTKFDTVTTAAAAVDTQAVAATVTAGEAANETTVTVEQ